MVLWRKLCGGQGRREEYRQMNEDQREGMESESASAGENLLDADRPIAVRRGYVLGILIAAIVVAEVAKDAIFSSDRGNWAPVCALLFDCVLACLPFLLARMAPKAAGFDTQWLPSSRRHWVWFLGMILLLAVARGLVAALAVAFVGHRSPARFVGPVTPITVVFTGIVMVIVVPVAEEIFFRGYFLEQLRKLTRSGTAVLIQAVLFGFFHLYTRGLFTSSALIDSLNAFLIGVIFGAWRIRFRSLLPLMIAHALCNAPGLISLKTRYDEIVYGPRLKYTVSRETTYLTRPLRKDGSVDYVAALDQQFRQGLTPENNAAVLFWKAVGPGDIRPADRDQYFQMLGIEALPEKGDYFVDSEEYIARREAGGQTSNAKPNAGTRDDMPDQLTAAQTRPWSGREFPVVAEWLAANEKPLALVVEASKRRRRYDPLCGGERTLLITVLLPAHQCYRHVAAALCTRAMLRLNEAKVEAAWEDLLTCHRLARLAGQSPMFVDSILAFSCEEMACMGDRALLQHADLTATRVAKMRGDLDRLSAMPEMADKIDGGERFAYLDVVSDYSRQGTGFLAGFVSPQMVELDPHFKRLKNTIDLLIRHSAGREVDWDYVLRMGNWWFDRIVYAYRMPTRAEQRQAIGELDAEIRKLKETAEDAQLLDELLRENAHKALSVRCSEVILTMFLPSVTTGRSFEDRLNMRFELDKLGFALAAYRIDHGAFPAKLADLAPKHVAKLPEDVFNNSDLHYRLEGKGYLLYSVGVNGKDDGGKSQEDRGKAGEEWDDLVVRVGAPGRE